MHWTRPDNPVSNTADGRLAQYKNRVEIIVKVGGALTGVLLVAVLAVAATSFSKDAPGALRATTIVLLLIGAVCIGSAWAGFHWKAVELGRRIETADRAEADAEAKKGRKRSKKRTKKAESAPASAASVEVGEWPARYEVVWTLGLYLLVLDVVALVVLTVWSAI
jgi:hypothetical protein